jgi:hypothetical protein
MLFNNSYDLDSYSLKNAQSVVAWQWHYNAFKKSFWNKVGLVMVAPLSLILGLFFLYERRSFTKHMRQKHYSFHTLSDYTKLRLQLDKATLLKPYLITLSKYDMKRIPFLLRFGGVQLKKMSRTLLQYFNWLEKEVNVLNTETFKSKSKTFKFTSEKELWQNRNKAYTYWM